MAPTPGLRARPAGRTAALGAAAALALLLALRGPGLYPDSASYLAGAPYRPPLYPAFLDVAHLLGGRLALRLVVFLLALLGGLSLLWCVDRLRRVLALPRLAALLLLVALAVGQLRFAGDIVSEALAAPLYLCFLTALIEAVVGGERGPLLWAVAWLVLGVLARPQLMFAWPVLLLAAGAWLSRGPPRRPGRASLALAIAGMVLCGWLAQHAANLARHGRWDGIHFTGLQLLTPAVYLADRQDLALFTDPEEHRYLATVFADLEARHLFAWSRPPRYSQSAFFADAYNDICHEVIEREFKPAAPAGALTIDEWAVLDRLTLGIARRLLARHPARFLGHVAGQAYGYEKSLALLVAGLAALALLFARRQPRFRALLVVVALWLSNVALVCAIEAPMARYFIYTDGPLVGLVLALLVGAAPPPEDA